jgi:alpha-D-ribose 1-methylphosphonate 5-triphosphate synthase subunit PhnH
MTAVIHPGFANPVRDSQAVFRAVLNAMARPGSIHTVTACKDPPNLLDCASAAILLTLVDGETTLWMDEQALASREWAAFHCGARLTAAANARFALALEAPRLSTLCAGTDEEPETAATLILQVKALGDGPRFRLEGPGLAAPTTLAVTGLSATFISDWSANRRLFPRGIDVILCAGDRLAALPRTVKLGRT